MKRAMAVVVMAVSVMFAPVASAAPYVSCPGGYIAHDLGECPQWPRPAIGITGHGGGGGGSGGGLLGTIGRVLGGLTGGLL